MTRWTYGWVMLSCRCRIRIVDAVRRVLNGGSALVKELASDPDLALEAARRLLAAGILVEARGR